MHHFLGQCTRFSFFGFLLFFVGFITAGCDSPRTEIVGQWSVDLSVLSQSEELKKISPPARRIVKKWKLNMMRDWYFSFDEQNNLEMKYQGAHYKGQYQVTKIIQRTMYIRTRMSPLPQNEIDVLLGITAPETLNILEEKLVVRFRNGQVILEIPDLEPLVLRREKALQI